MFSPGARGHTLSAGGCHGKGLWGEKASVCGALSRGAGGVRHNGTAPPAALFSCTVNGTFSFRRDEKRMWGWNCGFLRTIRADWLAPPQLRGAAPSRPKSRLRRFTSKRACGWLWGAAPPTPRVTFHRGKVTKARRGPSPEWQEAPGPLSAQKTKQTGPAGGCRGKALRGKIPAVGPILRCGPAEAGIFPFSISLRPSGEDSTA